MSISNFLQKKSFIDLNETDLEKLIKEVGEKPELPEKLKNILTKKEEYKKLPNNLKKVQNYILEKI